MRPWKYYTSLDRTSREISFCGSYYSTVGGDGSFPCPTNRRANVTSPEDRKSWKVTLKSHLNRLCNRAFRPGGLRRRGWDARLRQGGVRFSSASISHKAMPVGKCFFATLRNYVAKSATFRRTVRSDHPHNRSVNDCVHPPERITRQSATTSCLPRCARRKILSCKRLGGPGSRARHHGSNRTKSQKQRGPNAII